MIREEGFTCSVDFDFGDVNDALFFRRLLERFNVKTSLRCNRRYQNSTRIRRVELLKKVLKECDGGVTMMRLFKKVPLTGYAYKTFQRDVAFLVLDGFATTEKVKSHRGGFKVLVSWVNDGVEDEIKKESV